MWRVEEVREEEEEERVEMLTVTAVTVRWLVHPSLLDTRYVLMASEQYGVGQKWEHKQLLFDSCLHRILLSGLNHVKLTKRRRRRRRERKER